MRSFLRVLLYILTLVLGGYLVAVWHWPVVADQSARWAMGESGGLVCLGVGSALLASPLVILLRWLQSIRRNREISYTTDNGRISVNLIAIEEALNRAVEGEPEVKKAHVRVFQDKVQRSVVIEAMVTMWEVPNVTDRNRFLQRLLRRRFAELMPEQSQVDVNLHLHRLTERRIEPRPVPAPKPAKPEAKPSPASDTESGSRSSTKLPTLPSEAMNPVANALPREGDEPDLYVGPTYPVDTSDDDDESRIPVPPPKRR